MTQLRIELLSGADTGRQASFEAESISFGRRADNDIVLDVPEMSRRHGVIRFDDPYWVLDNDSPNGTTVNGRAVTDKPVRLRDGAIVGVGKASLFCVRLGPATEATGPADASRPALTGEEAVAAEERAKSRRIWISIGVWWVVLVIVCVALFLGRGDGDGDDGAVSVTALTDEQVERQIQHQAKLPADQRLAAERLAEARKQFAQRLASRRALYDAYRNYKQSLAYAGRNAFDDPIVHREYREAEKALVRTITEQYQQAVNLAASRRWAEAEEAFRQLEERYPAYDADDDKLFRSIQDHLRVARHNRPKRRLR